MQISRLAALAVLLGSMLGGSITTAAAGDTLVVSGCIIERAEKTITLKTTGGEHLTIDTTWLKPDMQDALPSECITVSTKIVDGKYMAESVEDGIEPNEVNSVTNETTSDRVNKSSKDDDDNDKNSSKDD